MMWFVPTSSAFAARASRKTWKKTEWLGAGSRGRGRPRTLSASSSAAIKTGAPSSRSTATVESTAASRLLDAPDPGMARAPGRGRIEEEDGPTDHLPIFVGAAADGERLAPHEGNALAASQATAIDPCSDLVGARLDPPAVVFEAKNGFRRKDELRPIEPE